MILVFFFFFSSRRRHTRWNCDWSSDVCSSDLVAGGLARRAGYLGPGVASVHNALVEPIEILSHGVPVDTVARSEERRVGKEWRSRGGRGDEKKKRREESERGGGRRC